MRRKSFKRLLAEVLRLTNSKRQPNISEIWKLFKDADVVRLNIKNFGYQLGTQLAPLLQEIDVSGQPARHGIVSKPTTQADVESPWFIHWCRELKTAPIYHRKLWEFAFALQALYEADLLRPGTTGIGFGCGEEPLASYFASNGIYATVTDLAPEKVVGMGWAETGQHTTAREQAWHPSIVDRESFDRLVTHRHVDMNDIPRDINACYDFCWSICALEHLGSIENGFRFIENSMNVLNKGGIAVHTTEYNYLSKDQTVDNWPTVLFLRRHFEQLMVRLGRAGYEVLGPDFDVGNGVLDRFVDIPPYSLGEGGLTRDSWGSDNQAAHLKLAVDGFACTCFGLIIRKPH